MAREIPTRQKAPPAPRFRGARAARPLLCRPLRHHPREARRLSSPQAQGARLERRRASRRSSGWSSASPSLGYVDDKGFASARTASLLRRGYGERRVRDALRGAGIAEEDSAEAREISRRGGAGRGAPFRPAPAARPLCREPSRTGPRGTRRRPRCFAPATAWIWSGRCSPPARKTCPSRMSHKNSRKRFTNRRKA